MYFHPTAALVIWFLFGSSALNMAGGGGGGGAEVEEAKHTYRSQALFSVPILCIMSIGLWHYFDSYVPKAKH